MGSFCYGFPMKQIHSHIWCLGIGRKVQCTLTAMTIEQAHHFNVGLLASTLVRSLCWLLPYKSLKRSLVNGGELKWEIFLWRKKFYLCYKLRMSSVVKRSPRQKIEDVKKYVTHRDIHTDMHSGLFGEWLYHFFNRENVLPLYQEET